MGIALAVTLTVGALSYRAGIATGRLVMYNELYDNLYNLKTGVQIKDIRVRVYEIYQNEALRSNSCGPCHIKPAKWVKVQYE